MPSTAEALRSTASCRAPECDGRASVRGFCKTHYHRFWLGDEFLRDLALEPFADKTFGHNCPSCADGGIVCPYFAVDGRVVEWRCIAEGHQPDTYLGRNFPARRAS